MVRKHSKFPSLGTELTLPPKWHVTALCKAQTPFGDCQMHGFGEGRTLVLTRAVEHPEITHPAHIQPPPDFFLPLRPPASPSQPTAGSSDAPKDVLTFSFKHADELCPHGHGHVGDKAGRQLLAVGHEVVAGRDEEVGDVGEEVQEATGSSRNICCEHREKREGKHQPTSHQLSIHRLRPFVQGGQDDELPNPVHSRAAAAGRGPNT